MLLREYWLNRISLTCALVGILILATYPFFETPKKVEISEISDKYLGTKVCVKGIIASSKVTSKVALFTLGYKAKVQGVFFKPGVKERILLQKGNFVEIVGKVKRYHNKIEIVAEMVNILD